MKGKALMKHSLHEKSAASVLLKLFIRSSAWAELHVLIVIQAYFIAILMISLYVEAYIKAISVFEKVYSANTTWVRPAHCLTSEL